MDMLKTRILAYQILEWMDDAGITQETAEELLELLELLGEAIKEKKWTTGIKN